jgi:PAS domain S-box-containing protein
VALRESEARFRQVVENIREVFWLSDVEKSSIIYISPGYEQIWGRKCEELYRSSQAWVEGIDPRDRERVLQAATTKQVTGEYDEVYRIVRPDGAVRWVRDRAYPVSEPDGQVRRVVGVAEDITDRKQLEEQFFRAQRMEAIGTLAGGIAHDLNNILAPVMMIVGLLKERMTSPGDAQNLRMVEASTQRGAAIIRQLLTFSRGTAAQERVLVQWRHLLRETGDLIRETFPREIAIRVDAPANLWPVRGDATQLHQVLMNLCVNARDAMPAGGSLSLKAANVVLDKEEARRLPPAQPGRYAVVTVEDTGEGIPPEIIDRIFDPFFTTKGIGKGTGLGLSTVLGIAKAHGGFVTVRSELAKGTGFSVYLPAETTDAPAPAAADTAAVAAGHGELILVVDDEADVLVAVTLLLKRHGYSVLTARNGKEALVQFAEHRSRIQLVLTDVMMPEMGGVALVRGIRALNPGIRVLATTGLGEEAIRSGLAAVGVPDLVQKPYTPLELLEAVQRCLKRP